MAAAVPVAVVVVVNGGDNAGVVGGVEDDPWRQHD